jgi:hypothetical protein
MKNKIGILAFIAWGIMVIITLSSLDKPNQAPKTVCFTSNNNIEIINSINKWSTYGYYVKFMLNQTIDISESRKFNSGSWEDIHTSTSKGNIIVIMEKS